MSNTVFVAQQRNLLASLETLGVDPESLCEFLADAIEAAETVQELKGDERSSRQINEAKLVQYILLKRSKLSA
jgi:hypothetical protein